MPLTSPDSIPYPAASDTVAPLNETLQGIAAATQAALSKRQQGSYIVTDAAGLAALTGMKQSDTAYVLATKTPYMFDGGTWRLATPHIEFNATQPAVLNSTLSPCGVFAIDSTNSTSTTIATPSASSGVIKITDPGLYAISTVTQLRQVGDAGPQAATGRTFLDMAFSAGVADIQRVSIVVGEDRGSMAAPNVRVTSPDQSIFFQFFRVVADPASITKTRVRITRIA